MVQLHAAMAVALNAQAAMAAAAAVAGAQAAAGPPAAAAAVNNIKIKQPEGFDGTRSDARRFIESMELYLGEVRVAPSFPDGQSKIRLALSLMTGMAANWAGALKREYLAHAQVVAAAAAGGQPAPALDNRCTDWTTFRNEFLVTFGDPDEN